MLALAAILTYGGFRVRERRADAGGGGGVPAIRAALLPADSGLEREVQHPAGRHGVVASAFSSCWIPTAARSAGFARARPLRGADGRGSAGHRVRPRLVRLSRAKTGCCATSASRIEPGETIAVVGHTGAGKTTLISLLLRFYDVQTGAIRMGGVDMRDFDPLELRRQFGVVLQDPYLFTGTLEENIRLGTEGIRREEVEAAAEQVNLLDFIRSLPEGFAHAIRERGSGLSTGQKQLISFARALAHNPRYLILDEATSSVDTETEFRVREALSRMVEGPHLDRHRAPAFHHPARRPHSGDAQRPTARSRHAPGTAGAARHLLEALPVAVQGPGHRPPGAEFPGGLSGTGGPRRCGRLRPGSRRRASRAGRSRAGGRRPASCSRQPGLAVAMMLAPVEFTASILLRQNLHGHFVLHHVVDAGAAAADVGAGHLAERQAGNGGQQLARRGADALAVGQVAGILVGDGGVHRPMSGFSSMAARNSVTSRMRRGELAAPWRRNRDRLPAARRIPSAWSRSRRRW